MHHIETKKFLTIEQIGIIFLVMGLTFFIPYVCLCMVVYPRLMSSDVSLVCGCVFVFCLVMHCIIRGYDDSMTCINTGGYIGENEKSDESLKNFEKKN